ESEAEARALYDAALSLGEQAELEGKLRRLLELAVPLVGADQGDIGLLDTSGEWLEYVASYGPRAGHLGSIAPLRRGQGIDGYVATSGLPVISEELADDPRAEHRDVMTSLGFHAYLCVPLR